MKRFLSIFVAIVMAMTMVVPAFAYTDTKDSDYNAAITFLSGLGVVNGYEDGSYQPEKVVTRAEMAKLLVVALGLDAGASLLEGTSSFDDVPTTHWATGYIAVAVQYGLIKGDGDGNFRPDDTVNYAEVATMTLRALGYDRMVDKNGQWPTNYLNKANELKIFDEIAEKFEGTDGATRGTVAQMLWNMLNTQMWAVNGENENDGLNYGKTEKTMLNIKFDKYSFADDLKYKGSAVTVEEEEWVVSLVFEGETTSNDDDITVKYAENDFYTFVPGTEFEALVYTANKKADPVIVSMFATDDNNLVEGNVYDLEDTYTLTTKNGQNTQPFNFDSDATYAYLLLDSARKSANVLGKVEVNGVANSLLVTDIKETQTATKIEFNDGSNIKVADEEEAFDDEAMILKDGKRETVLALEIGDVITYVGNIAVVTNDTIEGTYDGINVNQTIKEYEAIIEVDGEEYDFRTGLDATVIYNTDEDGKLVEFTNDEYANFVAKVKDNNFVGETATFHYNAFGDIAVIVFGEIDAAAIEGSFYLVTTGKIWAVADSEGSVEYIQLANEDGAKSYAISEDVTSASMNILEEDNIAGTILWVLFDDEGAIETVVKVANGVTLVNEDSEPQFDVTNVSATLNKDTNYIDGVKITSSTIVYTYTAILDEDDQETGKYALTISQGAEELDGVAANKILLALEDGVTNKAAYAFVAGEAESTDKNYGIVNGFSSRLGVDYVTIDGVKYELKGTTTAEAGDAVIFTINDEEAKITFVYSADEVANAAQVTDVDAEIVELEEGAIVIDLELLPTDIAAVTTAPNTTEGNALKALVFEDYKVFVVEVEYDDDDIFFSDFEEIELDEVKLSKDQGIAIKASEEVMVIINGIDWEYGI